MSRLRSLAARNGVLLTEESEREMRRMTEGEGVADAIAWAGPPLPDTLGALMQAEGLALVLAGLRYPGNVGFILRAAEVAGAAGVALDADWNASERASARRASMRAERFLPVVECGAEAALDAAVEAGRRIVAVETSGQASPWSVDLRSPAAIVFGGEAEGIPEALLARADAVVRIPTRGFIPSYNVQAAVGILLGEWLRQNES